MIHNDPTEKPIDRARGGSASDSEARMPGPRMASDPLMTMLAAMATQMFGARANRTSAGRDDPAT